MHSSRRLDRTVSRLPRIIITRIRGNLTVLCITVADAVDSEYGSGAGQQRGLLFDSADEKPPISPQARVGTNRAASQRLELLSLLYRSTGIGSNVAASWPLPQCATQGDQDGRHASVIVSHKIRCFRFMILWFFLSSPYTISSRKNLIHACCTPPLSQRLT